MTAYTLNCYWNPNWMHEIFTDNYSLETTLSVDGQLVARPGMIYGTPGFVAGIDTMVIALYVPSAKPQDGPFLDSVTVQFMPSADNPRTAPDIPLEAQGFKLQPETYCYSFTCNVSQQTPVEGAQTFCDAAGKSLFRFASPDPGWNGHGRWILNIQAVYQVPSSGRMLDASLVSHIGRGPDTCGVPDNSSVEYRTFGYDPEWVVGNGG